MKTGRLIAWAEILAALATPFAVRAGDEFDAARNAGNEWGEVPFYWWSCCSDPLTKERLLDQLDELAPLKPAGLQVNYCHGFRNGGYNWGLTLPSDPPIFSDAWWDLFAWWCRECQKRGIKVSLSDYTLSAPGQGFWADAILRERPDLRGKFLRLKDGKVVVEEDPRALDCLHPDLGALVVDKFFDEFERRLPKGLHANLGYFFSDELDFGGGNGFRWTPGFDERFEARHGHSPKEGYRYLFDTSDLGAAARRFRRDYWRTVVEMENEGFFKPLFDWHETRGLVYGCDHGGRGKDVAEFGDYMATQAWMQGPGSDQPQFQADVIKAKVASSIADLYHRPRVWLEGYYSSGWGSTLADVTDATLRNFAAGYNLLSLHGLYYSLYGGWFEWAPPCNHFRMPYYRPFMADWMRGLRALSYLMTRGEHVVDVRLRYPTDAVHVDPAHGKAAVEAVFTRGVELFDRGVDFIFVDDAHAALEQSVVPADADRDYVPPAGGERRVHHRRAENLDLYLLYGVTAGEAHRFRVPEGRRAELWDVWTGDRRPLAATRVGRQTEVVLPSDAPRGVLVAFVPGAAKPLPDEAAAATRRIEIRDFTTTLLPTRDNRFGDYRLPASDEILGAELAEASFAPEGGASRTMWCGYGPLWSRNGKPESISPRYGRQGDPGHQGYHGLKGRVTDEFMVLGKTDDETTVYETYLQVAQDGDCTAAVTGVRPTVFEVAGASVDPARFAVAKGVWPVRLTFRGKGRSGVVFRRAGAPDRVTSTPLAMTHFGDPELLPVAAVTSAVWTCRFTAPPGAETMSFTASDGTARTVRIDSRRPREMTLAFTNAAPAGLVFASPVKFACGEGEMSVGDWCGIDGLKSYSGGLRYRATFTLGDGETSAVLDLGKVAGAARVRVNGVTLPNRFLPPWRWTVPATALKTGANTLEIEVYNALANQYWTIPTDYRGSTASGLLAPVTLSVGRP